MSTFDTSAMVADKIHDLVVKAPAGGIFSVSEEGDTVASPVRQHDGAETLNGPSFFFVQVRDSSRVQTLRTVLVTVQDVS
jgi:hypothetical protein